jgi:hypothetical protein
MLKISERSEEEIAGRGRGRGEGEELVGVGCFLCGELVKIRVSVAISTRSACASSAVSCHREA